MKIHHPENGEQEDLPKSLTDVERFRLQADTALRYAEQVWWSWDLHTRHLKVRSVGECILGYPEGDLDHHESYWWRLVHPADRPEAEATLQDCFEGRSEEWHCEHRMRDVTGDWVWVAQSGFVLHRDKEGNPLEMVGTTRKKQECYQLLDIIRGSEALLDGFLQNSPVYFWLRDSGGMILLCSRAMNESFGPFDSCPDESAMVMPPAARDWQRLFRSAVHGEQTEQTITLTDTTGMRLTFVHSLIPITQGAEPFAVLEVFLPQSV